MWRTPINRLFVSAVNQLLSDRREIIANLSKQESLIMEFHKNLWFTLVDFATIHSENDVRFIFKDGTEIKAY